MLTTRKQVLRLSQSKAFRRLGLFDGQEKEETVDQQTFRHTLKRLSKSDLQSLWYELMDHMNVLRDEQARYLRPVWRRSNSTCVNLLIGDGEVTGTLPCLIQTLDRLKRVSDLLGIGDNRRIKEKN